MKEGQCKKLTKQDILDEERAERKRNYYATVKWTREVAKRAQANMEEGIQNKLYKYSKRFKKTGRKYQYEGDTSTSSDSDAIARVCESPEKKDAKDEEPSLLAEKQTEKAKKRFFPFSQRKLDAQRYRVLAPDTMDPYLSTGNNNSEGIVF